MILLAKKKQEEEKKKELILAQIKANEKKVLKDKARYLEKMVAAFLELNEIILDDLRGDGKVYYQFEKEKYVRVQRDGKFISEENINFKVRRNKIKRSTRSILLETISE